MCARRHKKHGFRKRMKSQGGRKVLAHAAKRGATASRASDARRGWIFRALAGWCAARNTTRCIAKGAAAASREFTIFLRPNGLDISRFGWSIKKALGNAVRRNRIRRRLREIVRLHRQEIAPGWDIVIHPRSSAATAEFSALTEELLKLLPASAKTRA